MPKKSISGQIALPADIKRTNRRLILNVMRSGNIMTAADINEQTGISRPTIMRALQYFCQKGIIKSLGLGSTTSMGGKKPELFVFSDQRKILCVNLWPKEISFALCDLISDVYALQSFPLTGTDDLDTAFEQVGRQADLYLAQQKLSLDDLYGVSLTVPGTVDYDTLTLRYNSQAPGWGNNVPIETYLKNIFGAKPAFFVDNAGKAVGRALLLDNPDYSERRVMSVFTTWGVSACLTERGHVLNGRDSLIGEIGHMVIADAEQSTCGCGKKGCLESQIAIRHIREKLASWGLQNAESITYPELFALSSQGNEAAQKAVRFAAHCFAVALHNLSLSYNQEIVIFQGDFADADELFDKALRSELNEFRYYPDGEFFSIVYDKRNLALLASRGAAEPLKKIYFSSVG